MQLIDTNTDVTLYLIDSIKIDRKNRSIFQNKHDINFVFSRNSPSLSTLIILPPVVPDGYTQGSHSWRTKQQK